MKNSLGYLTILVLVVSLGGGVFWNFQANDKLRQKQLLLRARAEEARRKMSEGNQVAAANGSDGMQKLMQTSAEAQDLRQRLDKMKSVLSKPLQNTQTPAASRVAEERWKNVGLATPTDTVQSVIWAATGGDIDQLVAMLAYSSEGRAIADALFASLSPESRKYFPSADKLMASLIASRIPTNLTKIQPISQSNADSDQIDATYILRRSIKSEEPGKGVTFRFQRVGSDWKLLVPNSIVTEFQRSLNAK